MLNLYEQCIFTHAMFNGQSAGRLSQNLKMLNYDYLFIWTNVMSCGPVANCYSHDVKSETSKQS